MNAQTDRAFAEAREALARRAKARRDDREQEDQARHSARVMDKVALGARNLFAHEPLMFVMLFGVSIYFIAQLDAWLMANSHEAWWWIVEHNNSMVHAVFRVAAQLLGDLP